MLIACEELLDHLLSLKFHVRMGVMAVLLGLSVFVMYHDYQLRRENFAVLREQAQPRPGESGLMAVVEPRPLSGFAKGLDEVMDRGENPRVAGVCQWVSIDARRSGCYKRQDAQT